jgi:hypothetical protein
MLIRTRHVSYRDMPIISLVSFPLPRDEDKWAYLLTKSTRFRPKAAPPRGKLLSGDRIDVTASPSPRVVPREPRPLSRAKFFSSPQGERESPRASRCGPTVIQMSTPQTRQLAPSRLSLPQLPRRQDDAKGDCGVGEDRLSRVLGYSRQGNDVLERLKSANRNTTPRTIPR